MEWIVDPNIWIALITLIVLEIVLGIDNIIFISILAGKLKVEEREKARLIGLTLAMVTRILLLFSITWVMQLTTPILTLIGREISGRDIILIIGGLFLIYKSTTEIHEKLEGEEEHGASGKATISFAGVIVQILILDIVFSLDSVITAVGMTDKIWIMVSAVVISVGFMLFFSGSISDFVNRHPTIKMLALSFLLLIGVTLIGEGFGQHIPKGYIYFAMAFSVFVEMLNLRIKAKAAPVKLHAKYHEEEKK